VDPAHHGALAYQGSPQHHPGDQTVTQEPGAG
jgi:hypothetical protein